MDSNTEDGPRWNAEHSGFETEGGVQAFVSGAGIVGSLSSFEEAAQMRLQGDFYNEPESVSRGVAIVAGVDMPTFAGEQDLFAMPGLAYDSFNTAPKDLKGSAVPAEPRFPENVLPAEVPPGGCLSTSVNLSGKAASAAQAAQCLHTFLKTKASASVCKVTPQKFAMKADVFHETSGLLVSCLMKVRVFSLAAAPAGSQLIVEFRRCCGDALAFSHAFQEAANHLRLHFRLDSGVTVPDFTSTPPPPPAPVVGADNPSNFKPLLDMAANDADPALQAEAVAALAALASASAAGATAMCAMLAGLREVVEGMCTSSRIDAAYPAARLTSKLAQYADQIEFAEELAFAALRGALADNTDDLVRVELAEAVRAVACQCASPEPRSRCINTHALRDALEEAFDKPALADHNSSVTRSLREALCTLEVVA